MSNKTFIPLLATLLGFMAILPDSKKLLEERDFTRYSIYSVVLTLMSLFLWAVVEVRSNNWVALSGVVVGLVINLYILYGILSTKESPLRESFPIGSTGVFY
jgi:uncharacterized protein with PQ loop repeat